MLTRLWSVEAEAPGKESAVSLWPSDLLDIRPMLRSRPTVQTRFDSYLNQVLGSGFINACGHKTMSPTYFAPLSSVCKQPLPSPLSFPVQKGQKHQPSWGVQLSVSPEFSVSPSGPGFGSRGVCSSDRVDGKHKAHLPRLRPGAPCGRRRGAAQPLTAHT